MRFIFVRHGETSINPQRIIHGANDPAELTESGREQVAKTIPALAKYAPQVIFSSEERRAKQTADLLARELQIPVHPLPQFRERNWGSFIGREWPDVERELSRMSTEERHRFTPVGGESWEAMEARLQEGLTILTNSGFERVAVVTHGGTLRALMPLLTGLPKESSFQYSFANCSLTVFERKDGQFKSITVNDTTHLESTA